MIVINENNLTKKTKFLQEILEFQKFAHRGLVAVNLFIFKYIISWDGMQCAWILYELFEYLSFTSEEGYILKLFLDNILIYTFILFRIKK